MTLDSEVIHLLSRNLMIAGFALAALANTWRKNWGYVLALLLAIFEAYSRYRFPLHNWAGNQILGFGAPPGEKEALQAKLLYGGGMTLLAALLLLTPYLIRANNGQRLMALGSFGIAATLSLELISPHRVDLIIYQTVGFFALAAIAYFVSSLLIAWGAIMDRRR